MNNSQDIKFPLNPPARGHFGAHGTCLIKDINFRGMRIVSGYSPPVGGKALVFIPAPHGHTPLPVEILESQACCPDKETSRHLSAGMVFSIRCGIQDLDENGRKSIVHLLESNFSRLRPASG